MKRRIPAMLAPGVALAVALLVLALPAAAQDRARTWIGAGAGTGGAKRSSEALALMGQLVHQRGANHFALRGVTIRDPFGEGSGSLTDVGLLYGRVAKGRQGHGAIAAGVAYTSACVGDTVCKILGVPVVAEAGYRPTPVLGIGVQAFANLNKQRVFGGVVVFLQLGWMP